jgi:hypothetical protein
MSILSGKHSPKQSRQNRCRIPTLSLYALWTEVTPEPKQQGYLESLHKRATAMYVDGMNLRKIARHLKVHHRTVALWVTDHAKALPNAPIPDEVRDAEMDELFTFIGDKKTAFTSLHL